MLSSQFIDGYPRTPYRQIERLHAGTDLHELHLQSQVFGTALHDLISGSPTPSIGNDFMNEYDNTGSEVYASTPNLALEMITKEECEAFRVRASHAMNWAMIGGWLELGRPPCEKGSQQQRERMQNLIEAQDKLSLFIGGLCVRRDMLCNSDPDYLNPRRGDNNPRYALSSVLAEGDMLMLGLRYAIEHPGVSIVPGPIQFERFAGRANTDAIMLRRHGGMPDKERTDTALSAEHPLTALGIQVKTTVDQEQVDRYDPDRVVVVEASTDFGAVRQVRILPDGTVTTSGPRKRGQFELNIPWPGMIGAAHFAKLSPKRATDPNTFIGMDEKTLCSLRLRVRQSIHGMKSNTDSSYRHVINKIQPRLELDWGNPKVNEHPTPKTVHLNHKVLAAK